MKKCYRPVVFLLIFVLTSRVTIAQSDTAKPVRIAVFTPLYLDDAFDDEGFKLGKITLPKNLLPGLEFYNGVMMAVDSLNKEGAVVEIDIYDTKSVSQPVTAILNGNALANTGLIIAAITSAPELKLFSDAALKRNIPLVSATYPNSAGVSRNPNFVLLNSTLKTHLEGIYNYLQKNYGTSKILMIKKKGARSDFVKTTFTDLNKKPRGVPLKMDWLELTDSFYSKQIVNKLDSFSNNVVVVASLYEDFGLKIVRNISANKSYRTTIVGMPTWDGIKELNRADCRNVDIVYSTPFFYSDNKLAQYTAKVYSEKFHSRPSDMVYRGFETVFHFTKLLLKYRADFVNNLSAKEYAVFNEADIQPVKIGLSDLPEYYENKKLYFLKKQEGNLKEVN